MPLDVKVGTSLRNRYVISNYIGDGGFSIVWRATDQEREREVAIKRMKKLGGDDLTILLDEAKKMVTLRGHKNIVELYEVFEDEGEAFLVMEYVDGSSLHDLFRKCVQSNKWISPEDALDYFKREFRLCSGFRAVAEMGVRQSRECRTETFISASSGSSRLGMSSRLS